MTVNHTQNQIPQRKKKRKKEQQEQQIGTQNRDVTADGEKKSFVDLLEKGGRKNCVV